MTIAATNKLRSAILNSRRPCSVEPLERRQLASTSTWTTDQISDYSSAAYFGSAVFGDDGEADGFATGSAGTYGSQQAWSYTCWDSDLDDGVDSGWRSLQLGVNVSPGTVSFVGGDGGQLTFSTAAGTQIHQVAIMADVGFAGLDVDWRSVNVFFYHNGSLVEQVSPTAPSANTMNASTNDPLESGVIVTPSSSSGTITGVYVSGQVRLRSAAGVYPGSSDLAATVAIS